MFQSKDAIRLRTKPLCTIFLSPALRTASWRRQERHLADRQATRHRLLLRQIRPSPNLRRRRLIYPVPSIPFPLPFLVTLLLPISLQPSSANTTTMRAFTLLLALPALTLAADQVPLMDQASAWFEKAKSYIPSAPLKDTVIDAGASAVAASRVEKITLQNYRRKLAPSMDGPLDWIVIVSSGNNASCFGGCESVNRLWNVSITFC